MIPQIVVAERSVFIFMFFKRKSIAFFIFKVRFTDFANPPFAFFFIFFCQLYRQGILIQQNCNQYKVKTQYHRDLY